MAGEYPDEIVAAFLALVQAAVPDVLTALDYEPEELYGEFELPAVTVFWATADDPVRESTKPATDVRWGWAIRVYCDIREQGWQAGQKELRELCPKLLLAVRRDPGLAGTGDFASLNDPGGEPEISTADGLIWKTFRLTVGKEELT